VAKKLAPAGLRISPKTIEHGVPGKKGWQVLAVAAPSSWSAHHGSALLLEGLPVESGDAQVWKVQ
jgi:hypothetical protein